MKVSEVIKWLETYETDEEIVVQWWDKDSMGNFGEFEISDEALAYADEYLGDSPALFRIKDIITEAIELYEQDKKESN